MIRLTPALALLVGAIVLWALTRKRPASVTIGDDVWASQNGTTWVPQLGDSSLDRAMGEALGR